MFHSHVALLQVKSSKTKERAAFVETELEKVITLVRSMPIDVENLGDDLERHALEDISNDINIKNSDQSKTKGRPKAKRTIGGVEAAQKSKYCKVPNCGGIGHDSRNCPNKRKISESPSSQSPNTFYRILASSSNRFLVDTASPTYKYKLHTFVKERIKKLIKMYKYSLKD